MEIRYEGAPPERRAHHVTFYHENKLYIHGGEDIYEGIIGSMWSLSLEFMESQAPPTWLPVNQSNMKYSPGKLAHHSCVVFNSSAYLVGGI